MNNFNRLSAFEPIGRQLKKIKEHNDPNSNIISISNVSNDKVSILSLDEQIRLLEQSLVNSNDDDDDDDGDDDDENEVNNNDKNDPSSDDQDFIKVINIKNKSQHHKVNNKISYIEQKDEQGRIVKLVSKLDETDRIQPLPKSLLPSKKCNFVSLTGNYNSNSNNNNNYPKKRVRFDHHDKSEIMSCYHGDHNDDDRTHQEPMIKPKEMIEIEENIRILLSQYQPITSQEKIPFYCRICRKQSNDMESFIFHKQSDYHNIAIKMERNMRYCKHCDKEFTSPDQLKGHIEGRAHKEQVQRLASRKRYNYHAE